MNPCPCGYFGDVVKECTCSPSLITRYRKPIPSTSFRTVSGPLLDRIDIHVEVPRVEYDPVVSAVGIAQTRGRTASSPMTGWGKPSVSIRARVEHARQKATW